MTMSEGPLRRWSRRKQAAQAAPSVAADAPELSMPELPPIESLGIASDYTAFLQQGVTAEVQRLALQCAWQSDESIAGFRGMAEYAWDFNAPDYGSLWATDDVAKLLQAVLTPPEDNLPESDMPESDMPVAAAELAAEPEPMKPAEPHQAESATEEPPGLVAAAQPVQEPYVRRHGGALPS